MEALVEPETRGDPMSPLKWTTKSTRNLSEALAGRGHQVSASTVATLLTGELGYSLQGNAKTIEGKQHPDRDAQFGYLNAQAEEHMAAGCPVISVDTKKKELVGRYKNGGREWRPGGEPEQVNVHDFADQDLGKAVPYGVYDVAANTGWVNVGTDHDTSQFAVQAIRRWWDTVGKDAYPDAGRLLICADGGGSNGHRTRLWKTELAELAAETGLEISVCHLPPGTSKWNKIEHRLFSHISMNWRGKPLTSHEVIVNTIAATTTRTGLKVHAELDTAGAAPRGSPPGRRAGRGGHAVLVRYDRSSERHQDSRPGDEGAGTGRDARPPRFPRRLELHPARQAGRHARDRPKLIPRERLVCGRSVHPISLVVTAPYQHADRVSGM